MDSDVAALPAADSTLLQSFMVCPAPDRSLMKKDVDLFVSEAKALGVPINVIEAVAALLKLTCDELGPDKDITEIIKPIEQRAGVEVRETGAG